MSAACNYPFTFSPDYGVQGILVRIYCGSRPTQVDPRYTDERSYSVIPTTGFLFHQQHTGILTTNSP